MPEVLDQKGLVFPTHRRIISKNAKSGNHPKSFGAFFARTFLEGFCDLNREYRIVLSLNGWKPTRFPTFTSMVRWLLSNNAPRETIEAVFDTAYIHLAMLGERKSSYNSYDEINFLHEYVQHKYKRLALTPFDYSRLPKHGRSAEEQDRYAESDF